MGGWRPGGRERLAVAIALFGGLVGSVLVLVVWSGLTEPDRTAVSGAARDQAGVLAVVAALGVTAFVALLAAALGRYTTAARRLAAETRLLLHANPDLRLDRSGPPEVAELAEAIDRLADQRRTAERAVAAQVEAARASLEQERNRLATLMAELSVAVVACTPDGRILLYNAAARSLVADDGSVGLGRSVFGLVDRDLVAFAADRFAAGSTEVQVATTVHGQQTLRVHLGAVRGAAGAPAGYVLVLEDLTEALRRSDQRDLLLRGLVEGTRAALGSLQAAIETVVDYPDMDPPEREQFLGIVRDEARALGRHVEGWAASSADDLGAALVLTEIAGEDLVALVGQAVRRAGSVHVTVLPVTAALWVRADSQALARVVVQLCRCLHEHLGPETAALTIAREGRYGRLELTWSGRAPEPEAFRSWINEPLSGGAASASIRDVVDRHGGEIWCAEEPAGSAYVRLLLPLTATVPIFGAGPPAEGGHRGGPGRPEFYDFQLFDWSEASTAWRDRRLSEVAYTVFDTETTGLDPTLGDEVVSVGAVRVLNGRVLRTETFERLVDPQRPVPAASTAFHGLTAAVLAGQPTIDAVLPAFARYAHDTVLVGHNVGFDLQFLRLKEVRTGVRLRQPVLDTLLLDAALHPDHDGHSLEAIADRLGVEVVGRHTAAGDALVTAEVLVRLLDLLAQRGVVTVGDAAELSRATRHARAGRSLYDETVPE
ncbi:MAG: exonuclease domain-containing protein [Cellulomonas sp.]